MANYDFYPYVSLESNVDINDLRYSLRVYDPVKNINYLDQSNSKISPYSKNLLIKSTNNFRTHILKIVVNDPAKIKECILIFDLFRISNSGDEVHVIKRYLSENRIEDFSYQNRYNVKLDIIKYKETKNVTKQTQPNNPNIVEVNLPSNRIFIEEKYRPGNSNDPFTKERVETSLYSRIKDPYPNQRSTYLCGPAAFFYCVLNSNKKIYAKIVKELWEKGEVKVNNLNIKPSLDGARKVNGFYKENKGVNNKITLNPRISPVDWITMGSLRDSENSVFDYNTAESQNIVGDSFNGFTAFTLPSDMERWLKNIGYKIVYTERNYSSRVDSLIKANAFSMKNHYLIALTMGAIVEGQPEIPRFSKLKVRGPSHWIVFTYNIKTKKGQLITSSTQHSEIVSAYCATWGSNQKIKDQELSFLSSNLYWFIVVEKTLN